MARTPRKPQPAQILTNSALHEELNGLPLTYTLRRLLLKLKAAEHCLHSLAERATLDAVKDSRPMPPLAFGHEVLRDAVNDLEHLHRISQQYEVMSAR
jgi:hypothetical protein